ncbi:MAG TPA: hypothetical protein VMH86_08140 [Rhizomicrobium sp.]|nr:hypothetical protein [Rhizomicrobium sp.]
MSVRLPVMAVLLVLAGCVSDPMPEGYSGPRANIEDSYSPRSGDGANFFFVAQVNGKDVYNALRRTIDVNNGNGFSLRPVVYARDLPAGPATLTIEGQSHYAAPIIALFSHNDDISGVVHVTLEAGHNYRVLGEMDGEHCAVWIEEAETGAPLGDRIEGKC